MVNNCHLWVVFPSFVINSLDIWGDYLFKFEDNPCDYDWRPLLSVRRYCLTKLVPRPERSRRSSDPLPHRQVSETWQMSIRVVGSRHGMSSYTSLRLQGTRRSNVLMNGPPSSGRQGEQTSLYTSFWYFLLWGSLSKENSSSNVGSDSVSIGVKCCLQVRRRVRQQLLNETGRLLLLVRRRLFPSTTAPQWNGGKTVSVRHLTHFHVSCLLLTTNDRVSSSTYRSRFTCLCPKQEVSTLGVPPNLPDTLKNEDKYSRNGGTPRVLELLFRDRTVYVFVMTEYTNVSLWLLSRRGYVGSYVTRRSGSFGREERAAGSLLNPENSSRSRRTPISKYS